MLKEYIITVFDGPAYGGGEQWPFTPVETVMAETAEEAVRKAEKAVIEAINEAAEAYPAHPVEVTIRAEGGNEVATETITA